jgi:hypothetical protein
VRVVVVATVPPVGTGGRVADLLVMLMAAVLLMACRMLVIRRMFVIDVPMLHSVRTCVGVRTQPAPTVHAMRLSTVRNLEHVV